MTLLEKLDYLMARDGLNSSLLSKKSGIPYTTIKGMYERGADRIQLTTLKSLAAFFSVPLDYLALDQYDKPEDFKPNGITVSTARENAMLEKYRALDDERKDIIDSVLNSVYETMRTKEKNVTKNA